MPRQSRLTSRLPAIAAKLDGAVHQAVQEGAEAIRDDAKMRAPDRAPMGVGLVAAIHTKTLSPGEVAVIAGDKDVFWGHFQEYGTAHHGAQPFLIPAYEAKKREVVQKIKRAGRRL